MSDSLTEEWRWVPGYEGRYEVSDLGNLRTWVNKGPSDRLRDEPKTLRTWENHRGIRRCGLSAEDGTRKQHSVHVLVLLAFVGPRPDGYHAAHHDDNHKDNRLVNLAWKTPGDNYRDRHINGRTARGKQCGAYKHGKYVGLKNYRTKYVDGLQIRGSDVGSNLCDRATP